MSPPLLSEVWTLQRRRWVTTHSRRLSASPTSPEREKKNLMHCGKKKNSYTRGSIDDCVHSRRVQTFFGGKKWGLPCNDEAAQQGPQKKKWWFDKIGWNFNYPAVQGGAVSSAIMPHGFKKKMGREEKKSGDDKSVILSSRPCGESGRRCSLQRESAHQYIPGPSTWWTSEQRCLFCFHRRGNRRETPSSCWPPSTQRKLHICLGSSD